MFQDTCTAATHCFARLKCSQLLLQKFSESAVDFIFVSDEKVFRPTAASLVNLWNDHVYAPMDTKKRDIAAQSLLTFS